MTTAATLFTKPQLLELTSEMIALQADRIRWLRCKEIEDAQPMPEISLALRVLSTYIDRAERLNVDAHRATAVSDYFGLDADDESDDEPTLAQAHAAYEKIVAALRQAEHAGRPSQPSPSPMTRAERRRAERDAPSTGTPHQPDATS